MKNFIVALKIISYMRQYEWPKKYSTEDLFNWFKIIWDNEEYSIRHFGKLKNLENKIEELEKINRRFRLSEEQRFHLIAKHNEEIIRLKDIIQAKEIQLEKLLNEGKK